MVSISGRSLLQMEVRFSISSVVRQNSARSVAIQLRDKGSCEIQFCEYENWFKAGLWFGHSRQGQKVPPLCGRVTRIQPTRSAAPTETGSALVSVLCWLLNWGGETLVAAIVGHLGWGTEGFKGPLNCWIFVKGECVRNIWNEGTCRFETATANTCCGRITTQFEAAAVSKPTVTMARACKKILP